MFFYVVGLVVFVVELALCWFFVCLLVSGISFASLSLESLSFF